MSKDAVMRQTIYYPSAWGIKYAKGEVLAPLVEAKGRDVTDQSGVDDAP